MVPVTAGLGMERFDWKLLLGKKGSIRYKQTQLGRVRINARWHPLAIAMFAADWTVTILDSIWWCLQHALVSSMYSFLYGQYLRDDGHDESGGKALIGEDWQRSRQ